MKPFLLLLILVAPVWAQPWLKVPLVVVPGQRLGPIVLGKPIPPEAYKLLGNVAGRAELSKISSPDGGGVEWLSGDLYIRVKCHDGKRPENVFQIFWTAPNVRTADGLGVGSPVAAVLKRYPGGRWTTQTLDGVPTYQTPGLDWGFDERRSRVTDMHLGKE